VYHTGVGRFLQRDRARESETAVVSLLRGSARRMRVPTGVRAVGFQNQWSGRHAYILGGNRPTVETDPSGLQALGDWNCTFNMYGLTGNCTLKWGPYEYACGLGNVELNIVGAFKASAEAMIALSVRDRQMKQEECQAKYTPATASTSIRPNFLPPGYTIETQVRRGDALSFTLATAVRSWGVGVRLTASIGGTFKPKIWYESCCFEGEGGISGAIDLDINVAGVALVALVAVYASAALPIIAADIVAALKALAGPAAAAAAGAAGSATP